MNGATPTRKNEEASSPLFRPTGKTPFDAQDLLAAGLDEMRRTICEREPPKPSTRLTQELVAADVRRRNTGELYQTAASPRRLQELIHQLRGDLDWIVMKCLEKDRARRYDTANGLAMDIERHLKNELVVARPPSNLYRFQKLVRRNKLAFGAGAAISTMLVLGVVASTWQAIRATRSQREQSRLREKAQQTEANEARLRQKAEADQKKAETEAAKSWQVSALLQAMLRGVDPDEAAGQDTTLLRNILDRTCRKRSRRCGAIPLRPRADLSKPL